MTNIVSGDETAWPSPPPETMGQTRARNAMEEPAANAAAKADQDKAVANQAVESEDNAIFINMPGRMPWSSPSKRRQRGPCSWR